MLLTINNTDVGLVPVKMDITKSDLYSDSSERTAETGRLLLYLIRRDVYTLDLEFLGRESEISALEELISGISLDVRFTENGNILRKTMYPSDRTKTPVGTENSRKYRLSFSLIER